MWHELPNDTQNLLADSISNAFIETAMKTENAAHEWYVRDVSEPAYSEKRIQQNWTSRGEIAVDAGVKPQNLSILLMYSPFSVTSHGAYITVSKTEAILMWKS